MTKDEIIKELLKRKVIFKVGRGYFISKESQRNTFCKNFPKEFKELSISKIYDDLLTVVPLRATLKNTSYIVKTKTQKAQRELQKIIVNPDIDYVKLKRVIKDYYNSDVVVKGFAKLLENGELLVLYNNPVKNEEQDNTIWK